MDTEEIYDKLYRYCYMKTKHQQTAEDMTQEIFLRFLEAHSYQEMGKQMAYLYTIARNLCIDYYRMQPVIPLEEKEASLTEDHIDEHTTNLALEQAMEKLSEEDRELLFLRYTIEIPVGEIAKILQISRFAVYRREKHALKKLRTQLNRSDFYD